MGQGNFSTRSWVCLGGLFAGDWRIFGVEVEKGVFNDRASLVRRFCGSSGHTGSFRALFPHLFLRLMVSIPRVFGTPIKGRLPSGSKYRRSSSVHRVRWCRFLSTQLTIFPRWLSLVSKDGSLYNYLGRVTKGSSLPLTQLKD